MTNKPFSGVLYGRRAYGGVHFMASLLDSVHCADRSTVADQRSQSEEAGGPAVLIISKPNQGVL
jgi:hypothetical protein